MRNKLIILAVTCLCTANAINMYDSIYSKCASDKAQLPDKPILFNMFEVDENDPILKSSKTISAAVENSSIDTASVVSNDNNITTSSIQLIQIDSIPMKYKGTTKYTDEVKINVNSLLYSYNNKNYPSWDKLHKIDTLSVLWDFLVIQHGITPEIASGLLGNIYKEGDFALQQGTNLHISNINQARVLLGSGGTGYGIAQWTYSTRQKALLNYYEKAYEQFPDNYDAMCITAECCMLLEECKIYDVFDDMSMSMSIEDATGRVAMNYESYKGCSSEWVYVDGVYKLVNGAVNGKERLDYAYHIYEYFME